MYYMSGGGGGSLRDLSLAAEEVVINQEHLLTYAAKILDLMYSILDSSNWVVEVDDEAYD